MQFEEINTARLVLRKLTPEVFRYVFSHYPDDELQHFLGVASREELDREKEKYILGFSTYNRSFVMFQVWDAVTKIYIGHCGFHTWYTEHRRAEVGYALTNESFRGKGIMSEVLEIVIRYGFEQMDLNRIEAFVGPANEPSLKLIAKNGFTKEGHMRQHYNKGERIEDSLVFSLLREEYHHGNK